jgi:antitoxin (DNA-binding transcriptional repressor) of toxin-antitoxin stability system
MSVVKIDDIRDQVEALVSRVEAGETILIERDGRTVAKIEALEVLSPEPEIGQEFDWEALRRFTDSQPLQAESAGDFLRRMRDEARY